MAVYMCSSVLDGACTAWVAVESPPALTSDDIADAYALGAALIWGPWLLAWVARIVITGLNLSK